MSKPVFLRKGSSSKKGGQEAADTLFAQYVGRGIYLISEGPVQGLHTGDSKSIFFNDVPLMDSAGIVLFNGVSWTFRNGDPDQDHLPGFNGVSEDVAVGAQVFFGIPVTESVPDGFDAVKVFISIPSLANGDSNGNLKGTDLSYEIDVQAFGGSWVTAVTENLHNQKTTSEWRKGYRIDLPGVGPWNIRLKRLTADSGTITLQNDLYFESYEKIIDGKFNYRNSCVLGAQFDAKQFGAQLPTVKVLVDGVKVWVPKNYDPVARTYATSGAGTSGGIWDGTFKAAFTSNPVWVYYDLLVNNRYGLGQDLGINDNPENDLVDASSLYVLSQYCDATLDDGYGGTRPRFTCNIQITDKQEAYSLLQQITSIFNGMVYFSSQTLFVTADTPDTVDEIFTQADVVDGLFNYTGSALKTRHSVCTVAYTNADNLYKRDFVTWEDADLIAEIGYREVQVQAIGCTNRAEALYRAKWVIETEKAQKEVLNFTSSMKGGHLTPGKIVKIFDDHKAGRRAGGRFVSSTTTSTTDFVLDQHVTVTTGDHLLWVDTDGVLHNVAFHASYTNTANVSVSGVLSLPVTGGSYGIVYADLDGALYKVLNRSENSDGFYEIVALQHDENKFAFIEEGVVLDVHPTSVISTDALPVPSNLDITEWFTEQSGAEALPQITVSWTPPSDNRVDLFEIQLKTPLADYYTVYTGSYPSWDSDPLPVDLSNGYRVRIRSLGAYNTFSTWLYSGAFSLVGVNDAPASPSGIALANDINTIILSWDMPIIFNFDHVEIWENTVNNSATATHIADISDTFYIRTLTDIATRYYWLKTVTHAATNNVSAFSTVISGHARLIGSSDIDTSAGATPAVPTGLALSSTLVFDPDGTSFVRLIADWNDNTETDLVGYEIALQQGSGTFNITAVASSYYVFNVTGNSSYTAKVRAVNVLGNKSAYTSTQTITTTYDTTPPGLPTSIAATAGMGEIYITWTNPSDVDLDHVDIYENTVNNSGTATKIATKSAVFSTPGFFTRAGLIGGTTRYYFLKSVDTTGNQSAFTSEVHTTTVFVVDTVAPAVPTSLALGSNISFDTDGTQIIYLTATWTANIEPDLAGYTIAIQEASGTFYQHDAGLANAFYMVVKANTSYTAKVLAYDLFGNNSAFSSTVSHTTTSDTTAPSAPTSLTATGLIGSNFLSWTNPSASDLATVKIWVNTVNTFGSASLLATVAALPSAPGTYTHSVTTSTQRYYWLTALDTSNNSSTNTSSVTATAITISAPDITPNTITADQIVVGIFGGHNLAPKTAFNEVVSNFPVGWFLYNNAGISVTYAVTSGGMFGTNYFRLTANATVTNTFGLGTGRNSITAGVDQWDSTQTYVISAWVRAQSGSGFIGRHVDLTFSNMGFTSAVAIENPAITTAWQRISTRVVPANNSFTQYGELYLSWDQLGGSVASTSSLDFCAIQVELGTVPTSWGPNPNAPGEITSTIIADGAITTNKITALAITAAKIAANTITAAQIFAGTITATEIAASTITGAKIAAGTITASNIAAGTITTDKLTVGGIVGPNLIFNPGAESGTLDTWTRSVAWNNFTFDVVSSDFNSGQYSFRLNKPTTGDNVGACSNTFPVIAGKTYAVRARYKGSSGTASGLYVRFLSKTTYAAQIHDGNTTHTNDLLSNAAVTTSWQTADSAITIPAGDMFAAIEVINFTAAPTTVLFDDIEVVQQAETTSIIDGIITTNKIAANQITAAKIATGTITANEIAATTITGAKIAANTITASNLSVSTLSSITANIGTITSGTIDISGSLVIQSGSSGARLVITAGLVSVYDASNVLRVRMGIW